MAELGAEPDRRRSTRARTERNCGTLQRYAHDPRIRIAYQANRGTGPTRDALASISTGDFILAVDDDDALAEDALEAFASAILHNRDAPFFRAGRN